MKKLQSMIIFVFMVAVSCFALLAGAQLKENKAAIEAIEKRVAVLEKDSAETKKVFAEIYKNLEAQED